jgi:hypothetical protein
LLRKDFQRKLSCEMQPRRGHVRGLRTAPGGDISAVLHDLVNLLGALRLRLRVLSADPTCNWAQEENLTVMADIVERAIVATTRLRVDAGVNVTPTLPAAPGVRAESKKKASGPRRGRG